MDLRYNMINWVHRAQRGWSYGAAVIDPRTGEIIKGNVTLGSLRIRQDVMIAEGLIPQFDELHDQALSALDPATSPSMMALARIRQLAAHETGHTLGLDHNMAASSYGRASVMDYPSPYVKITNGKLDLSDAYATGIGSYDKWVIRYAYAQFSAAERRARARSHRARGAALHHRSGIASGQRRASGGVGVGCAGQQRRHAAPRDRSAPHRACRSSDCATFRWVRRWRSSKRCSSRSTCIIVSSWRPRRNRSADSITRTASRKKADSFRRRRGVSFRRRRSAMR